MADAGGLDLYDCHICLENMMDKDPRVLSCLHSFCLSCLKKLVTRNEITCPTCRETTVISRGDVSLLKADFKLTQFKEHMEKILSSKTVLCQLCRSTKAELKCQECIQILCEGCSQKHNKLKTFAGHNLCKLCPDHAEGMITHLCTKCVKPACFNCVMMKHVEHEAEVMAIKDGIQTLLLECEQKEELLNKKEKEIAEVSQGRSEEIESTEEFITRAREIKQYYLNKVDEIQEIEEQAKHSATEARKFITKCEAQKLTVMELKQLFSVSKEQLKHQIVDKFYTARLKVDKLLHGGQNQFEFPVFCLQDPLSGDEINNKSNSNKLIKYLTNPLLVKTFQGDWSMPWRISKVDGNSIIVTDTGKNTSTVLCLDDKPLLKIEVNGKIKDAKIYAEKLFLFYNRYILIKHFPSQDDIDIAEHGIINIRAAIVIDDSNFAFLCTNSVDVFDATSKIHKVVIAGLKNPKSLTLNPNQGKHMCYAVTSIRPHNVYVYDDQWNRIMVLGGKDTKFNEPFDTTFTPDGILVTDAINKRVCQFDHKGKFVKSILTSDLINSVAISILFIKPYLWYFGNSPVEIKCFKICK